MIKLFVLLDTASISGHTDFYYPNLTYQLAQYQQELPEITKIKRIPIPHELVEQFNRKSTATNARQLLLFIS